MASSNPLTTGNIVNGAARPANANVEPFPSNKPMTPAQLLEIQESVTSVVARMGKALQTPTDKNNQSKFADILMQNMPTITHIARTTPYSSEQIVRV
jgi:hypothetical protein